MSCESPRKEPMSCNARRESTIGQNQIDSPAFDNQRPVAWRSTAVVFDYAALGSQARDAWRVMSRTIYGSLFARLHFEHSISFFGVLLRTYKPFAFSLRYMCMRSHMHVQTIMQEQLWLSADVHASSLWRSDDSVISCFVLERSGSKSQHDFIIFPSNS